MIGSELDSIAVVLAFVMIVIIGRSIVFVPDGVAYVVERLGVFDRVLRPGVHVTIPFVSRISDRISIREQAVDVPATACVLKDGAPATFTGSLEFRVTDPALVVAAGSDVRTLLVWAAVTEWTRTLAAAEARAVEEAVQTAEPSIKAAAATWGLELLEVRPVVTLTDAEMGHVEAHVSEERDACVAAWALARQLTLTADGRPTAEQRLAYDEWMGDDQHRSRDATDSAGASEWVSGADVTATEPVAEVTHFPPPARQIRFAVASGTIAAGALGLVDVDGHTRTARNLSAVEIPRGFRCVVDGEDGETLLVRCV